MVRTRVRRPRGKSKHFVAGANGAGSDLAGKAAEILIGANDALHGQAKACLCPLDGEGHGFKKFEQAGAVVPGDALAAMNDVVAFERADGNGN